MGITNWLKRLRKDESGNVVVLGAAVMPMLIGSAALALDTVQLSMWKRQLQRQADSAALAGAFAVEQGKSAAAAVTRDLLLNDQVPLDSTVVNNAPLSGPYTGNAKAVEVLLTSQRDLPFIAFFMADAPIIEARAVAVKLGGDNNCILALEKTEKEALLFNGNADLNMGCGIKSNSKNADAAKITGNFKLGATAVSAVGGLNFSGNVVFPTNKRFPNSTADVDPYGPAGKNLQVPTLPTACTKTNYEINDKTETLNPGRYCGFLSINGKSNVTFNPGVYIIAGEFFKINGSAAVSGNGVTFILTSRSGKNATMDWNGDATIDFQAPKLSTGSTYAGVLVMGDPNEPTSNKHNLNGNLKLKMRGALYFPKGQLFWNGNTTVNADCLQLIARTININGNPTIPNTCTADDAAPGFLAAKVRLVE